MAKENANWFALGARYNYWSNGAAIAISKNPVFHGKTKHFSIKLFFLRDVQRDGAVCLKYCKTEDQLSDIFTKALPKSKFELLREKLGLVKHWYKEECWTCVSAVAY